MEMKEWWYQNILASYWLKFDGRVESLRKRDKKMKGIMIRNYFNYSKTGQSTWLNFDTHQGFARCKYSSKEGVREAAIDYQSRSVFGIGLETGVSVYRRIWWMVCLCSTLHCWPSPPPDTMMVHCLHDPCTQCTMFRQGQDYISSAGVASRI